MLPARAQMSHSVCTQVQSLTYPILNSDSYEVVAILANDVRQILLAASFPIATCAKSGNMFSFQDGGSTLTAMNPNKNRKAISIWRSPNVQYETVLVTIAYGRIPSVRTLRTHGSIVLC